MARGFSHTDFPEAPNPPPDDSSLDGGGGRYASAYQYHTPYAKHEQGKRHEEMPSSAPTSASAVWTRMTAPLTRGDDQRHLADPRGRSTSTRPRMFQHKSTERTP